MSDLQAGWGRSGIERACGFLFEGTCAFGLGGLTRSRNVVIAGTLCSQEAVAMGDTMVVHIHGRGKNLRHACLGVKVPAQCY